jgi:HEAT repeat protein
VPLLTRLLSDSDEDVRFYAAFGLGESGNRARESIPGLEKLLGDENLEIRRAAAEALEKVRAAEQKCKSE